MQLRRSLVFLLATVASAALAQPMQHPGILVSRRQLDFVKQQVAKKNEPFYGQYQKAVASQYAALDYKMQGPPPTGIIDCGPYSKPDHGCHAEDTDATAACLQSLLWWISGDHRYADNAIRIMNAYSHQLTAYTSSNAPLRLRGARRCGSEPRRSSAIVLRAGSRRIYRPSAQCSQRSTFR